MKSRSMFLALSMLCLGSHDAMALDRTLFVINGLAETLSSVNLETNVVSNNTTVLGLVPNQVFIDNERRRDTIGYVVNSISDNLQLVHLGTGATLNSISLGEGRNPFGLAFIDDSVVAISNLLTNTLSEVNTRNGTVISEYSVGTAPEGMVCHNGLLFVCLTALDYTTFVYGQGEVAVVDPATDSVLATIPVGQNPQAIVTDYDGDLLVLCTGNYASTFGMIYVIDPLARLVTDSVFTGGSPGHIQLAADGHAYIAAGGWVTQGEVYVYDSRNNIMLHDSDNPIHVGIGAVATTSDVFGNVYVCEFSVDQISRIDSDTVTITYDLGDGPGFAAIYEPLPPGDFNGSGSVSSADVIHAVNFVFKGGAQPHNFVLGDVNRTCTISLVDVITVVNFVFRNGPSMLYGCY